MCSFVGSLLVVVACVDFYGTFGIYSTYVRVTLYSISHTPIALSVGMEIFQELIVAISFLAYVSRDFYAVSILSSKFRRLPVIIQNDAPSWNT